MKIICDRKHFLTALSLASAAVPSKTPKPILQWVKLVALREEETAILLATNSELSIKVQIENVSVRDSGECLLPTSKIHSIVRESRADELMLSTTDNGLSLHCGNDRFNFLSLDPAEFPTFGMAVAEEQGIKLSGEVLKRAIRRTLFASDEGAARFALGGLLLDLNQENSELAIVATDGRRLAAFTTKVWAGGQVDKQDFHIVPAAAARLIERSITNENDTCLIVPTRNNVVACMSGLEVIGRLLEGRYPDWHLATDPVNSFSRHARVKAAPLMSAMRQAGVITNDESRGVNFLFTQERITVSAETGNVGKLEVHVDLDECNLGDGETVTRILDPANVEEFLKTLEVDQEVSIFFSDDAGDAVCFRTDDGSMYVVMPMTPEEKNKKGKGEGKGESKGKGKGKRAEGNQEEREAVAYSNSDPF